MIHLRTFPHAEAATAPQVQTQPSWRDFAALILVVGFVIATYLSRATTLPAVGEETRWATGAREMLATGDWIVPRQQGQVFPERPPMTMWAMAAVGWMRGGVDLVAIRLPSVLAVVFTCLAIYIYTRALVSRIAAVVAALVYATMGQVIQIGRLGESEALFTLFVSASLLLWHLGYTRGWPVFTTWCVGFACAALGALVKGPQAPVYFVSITAVYVCLQRKWRYLFHWQYAAGVCLFATMIAAWQVPFYLATDWPTVKATWSGLAADRIHFGGIVKHLITYPIETFVCLLPWSPLLVGLVKRETRTLFADYRNVTTFLTTAIVIAYPTVWFATGARGRYFMPLYPLVAILIGLIIERCCIASPGTYPRRAWHQFLLLSGSLIAAGGLVIGIGSLLPTDVARSIQQPHSLGVLLLAIAAVVISVQWKCYRNSHRFQPWLAVFAIAAFVGIAYVGVVINVHKVRWNNPVRAVAKVKDALPPGAALVSFSPIEHRFAYYFDAPIPELDWPTRLEDLPAGVEYFCFMRNAGDTAERRAAGRGRSWWTTPGTLPFAWQEIMSFNAERSLKDPRTVVIGRVIRPLRAEISDVTRPQFATAVRVSSEVLNYQDTKPRR